MPLGRSSHFFKILSPVSVLEQDFVQLDPVPETMPWTSKKDMATTKKTVRKSGSSRKKDSIRTAGDVKRVMNQSAPIRFWLHNVSANVSNTISNIYPVSLIPFQADPTADLGARNSKKVYLNRYRFRGVCSVAAGLPGTGDVTNRFRLMIVRQKTNQQGVFNATDALETNDGTFQYTIDTPSNQKRCEIIWEKEYQVQQAVAGAVYPSYQKIEIDVPLHRTAKYDATPNGSASSPVNNSYYALVAISDSGTTPHPTLRGQGQTVFKNID